MVKIIKFSGITTHDIDPDMVLEMAKGKLEGVVVIGFEKPQNGNGKDDNGELYAASSYGDGGTVLWLLRATELRLFDIYMNYEED